MSEVRIEHVFKRFGDVTAVSDFDLTVKDGEFVSLLGPSGCGKTTSLRMIAGFERATEGEIYIGDPIRISIKLAYKKYFRTARKTRYRHGFPVLCRMAAHDCYRKRCISA